MLIGKYFPEDHSKQRAAEYVKVGDLVNAVASMGSDMAKHPETNAPVLPTLVLLGMREIERGPEAVQRWIDGFN